MWLKNPSGWRPYRGGASWEMRDPGKAVSGLLKILLFKYCPSIFVVS